jgi:3-oxoacyl-[acyl-carrier protein] reductase
MAAVQEKSFTGKVALVTAGSKGIGAGIVRRLASEGASVAFTFLEFGRKGLETCTRGRIRGRESACLPGERN